MTQCWKRGLQQQWGASVSTLGPGCGQGNLCSIFIGYVTSLVMWPLQGYVIVTMLRDVDQVAWHSSRSDPPLSDVCRHVNAVFLTTSSQCGQPNSEIRFKTLGIRDRAQPTKRCVEGCRCQLWSPASCKHSTGTVIVRCNPSFESEIRIYPQIRKVLMRISSTWQT